MHTRDEQKERTHDSILASASRLLRERGIHVRNINLDPRRMIAAYGQMDFVICQMLHASILATNSGVPSMNIAYDVKNTSFYELIGLPQLCLPRCSHRQLSPGDRTVIA